MNNKRSALLYLASMILFCVQSRSGTPHIPATCPSDWFTIFVHGTFGLRHNVSLNTLVSFWKDDIDDTPYKHKVETARNDSYFYFLQPIQECGLKSISLDTSCYRGPEIFATAYDRVQQVHNAAYKNSYYTFGWSGLLSAKKRLAEAYELYAQLARERKNYKTRTGTYPKIRLIGYSHGGSVCLNLAHARKSRPQDSFCIDELILLATPVQETTRDLIYEEIFKKIYHLYSSGDCLQRLDFFGPCSLLSNKKFKGNCERPLPEKLVQIRIAISEQSRKTEMGKTRRRISKAPGHIELWFFGWTPNMYRKSFPFYPLPFAVFIPYVIDAIEKYTPGQPRVNLQIKPDCELLYIQTPDQPKITVPFLPFSFIHDLQNQILRMHPHQFSKQDQVIYRELTPKLQENRPCLFAAPAVEVFPQVCKKHYSDKSEHYFSTCAEAEQKPAL